MQARQAQLNRIRVHNSRPLDLPQIVTRCSAALIGLGSLLLMTSCSAEKNTSSSEKPNIILISIDSLRADHVGCYGYEPPTTPFLDGMAARGARFENALSTTSWTLPSHAAMFTGLFDSTHGLVDNGLALSGGHRTLAELLSSSGYHTAGFYGGPYLEPTFGLGQGFDVYESCMTTTPAGLNGQQIRQSAMSHKAPSHADITGPRTLEKVSEWAGARPNGDSPYFLFLHMWDVHYDFLPPQEYVDMFDPDYSGNIDGALMSNPAIQPGMSKRDLEHVLALYDGEIRFTDDILRRIFEKLEKNDLLENTLILITADHGEEFFEHGGKGHNRTLFEESVRVPLIAVWTDVIEPGLEIKDQVQIVDLYPTAAYAAGYRKALPTQGRNLAKLLAGQSVADSPSALLELLLDRGEQRALRNNQAKYYSPGRGAQPMVFDLANDPKERSPQPANSPAGSAIWPAANELLKSTLERNQRLHQMLGNLDPDSIDLDPAMQKQLKALGYMGDSEDE